jgi:hypothetical protein
MAYTWDIASLVTTKGMESMSQDPRREIARRLIDSRRQERTGADTAARAAASACDHLYRELSRWVGVDGCHALFTRALSQARIEHPALTPIQLRARSEPYIDDLAASIMAYGDAGTAEALESMLVRLLELLGRLIGYDMAMKLVGRSLASPEGSDATPGSSREEA